MFYVFSESIVYFELVSDLMDVKWNVELAQGRSFSMYSEIWVSELFDVEVVFNFLQGLIMRKETLCMNA